MYMTRDLAEHVKLSSNCNFVKLLGGVPNLERLNSFMDFTKVTFYIYRYRFLNLIHHPFAYSFAIIVTNK
jgi:hypothetical protein